MSGSVVKEFDSLLGEDDTRRGLDWAGRDKETLGSVSEKQRSCPLMDTAQGSLQSGRLGLECMSNTTKLGLS